MDVRADEKVEWNMTLLMKQTVRATLSTNVEYCFTKCSVQAVLSTRFKKLKVRLLLIIILKMTNEHLDVI